MATHVYRCGHCGREVLVRRAGPMTEQEIARRKEEEMRPPAQGRRAPGGMSERLRDDIWLGVSGTREMVPRDEPPERCPACGRAELSETRTVE
jgi:DNA-directed RNA polymerase subunit RPC12/RpoP